MSRPPKAGHAPQKSPYVIVTGWRSLTQKETSVLQASFALFWPLFFSIKVNHVEKEEEEEEEEEEETTFQTATSTSSKTPPGPTWMHGAPIATFLGAMQCTMQCDAIKIVELQQYHLERDKRSIRR
jgi:hypothetical protein